MNKEDNIKLEEAHTRACKYINAFIDNKISIEKLRYVMIQLVRLTTIKDPTLNTSFIERDGIALVNQLIDEYISDPVLYGYNIYDSAYKELSISNLFMPDLADAGALNSDSDSEE